MKPNSLKSGSAIAALVFAAVATMPAAWAQTGKPEAEPPPPPIVSTPAPARASEPARVPATASVIVAPPAAPAKPSSAAPATPATAAANVATGSSPKRHSRRNEDARHCLALPTNTAVIKCAEQYL